MQKRALIIAGPNGAGKTTFARSFLPFEANCRRYGLGRKLRSLFFSEREGLAVLVVGHISRYEASSRLASPPLSGKIPDLNFRPSPISTRT